MDLFCGAGGLASGFAAEGYDITGVDRLPEAAKVFSLNGLGVAETASLHHKTFSRDFEVVIGGPPCRPWSSVNLTRRRKDHGNFGLLARFASHVICNNPRAFLMENVPPAKHDVLGLVPRLEKHGYSVGMRTVRYSDYGAPTSRMRLIMVGSRGSDADAFFDELCKYKAPGATVRDAIGHLESAEYGAVPDHVYPFFQSIENYIDRYESGQFGWTRLNWNQPAPSFGNVTKTYTLHPSSWKSRPPRVISVREALLLMGFPLSFKFPEGIGMRRRYQMVSDSVSPVFSRVAAKALTALI